MSLKKDIATLLKIGLINQETADNIAHYYAEQEEQSGNRIFIIFGILGAILVGLGIILIIAHNWDNLSNLIKTLLAYLPLLSSQVLVAFALFKKAQSTAWKESSSTLLFFAVGATLSLVSQIYHIPGNLSSYILTWVLLCLPLVYLMRSAMVAMLYLIGITYYGSEVGYWTNQSGESYTYWLLLVLILPYYYYLYQKKPRSNFTLFLHWLIPLSIMINLGTLSYKHSELMFIAYFSLLGLFYNFGNTLFLPKQQKLNNSYTLIGSLGTISMLLALSFDWFWKELSNFKFSFSSLISSPEFIASIILSILAAVLWYLSAIKNKSFRLDKNPISIIFALFIGLFIIGLSSMPLALIATNLLIFILGLLSIRNGIQQQHLGLLNYGLLTISALIACRFFDTNLTFTARGILFISIGLGFFGANYWLLKNKTTHE